MMSLFDGGRRPSSLRFEGDLRPLNSADIKRTVKHGGLAKISSDGAVRMESVKKKGIR